ncbi:hypothetical protein KGQ25_02335, partial [Patescibacteria group bacterium]|nr:hypothetical protein [Patescibacteria group bacterium]
MEGLTVAVFEVAPPVEKPRPVQEVAFLELQVRVEEEPLVIEVGEAERVTVGAGVVVVTVTVALELLVPPEPVQETEYVVVVEGYTTAVFEVAPPVEKPVPVQEVALLELQVRVEEEPLVIEVGEAERVTVGAG